LHGYSDINILPALEVVKLFCALFVLRFWI